MSKTLKKSEAISFKEIMAKIDQIDQELKQLDISELERWTELYKEGKKWITLAQDKIKTFEALIADVKDQE